MRLFDAHRTWEDWFGVAVGLLIGLSPWFAGQPDNTAVTWITVAVGIGVVLFAGRQLVDPERSEVAGLLVCGLWLIALPFTFDYAEWGALRYWHFILGAIVVLIAALELWQDWKRRASYSDALRQELEVTMEAHTAGKSRPKLHNLIASDRVEGTQVCRLNGNKIGTIQRLMIDKLSGNVAYAVLSFGGFLGMGQKHLPIPWGRLQYDPIEGAYVLDFTDEEFSRAPAYEADQEFDWGARSQEVVIHNYYRAPHYWGY